MRLPAELTEKGVKIRGILAVPSIRIYGPLSFFIDTGSEITTISEVEAEKLKIDWETLEHAHKPIITMGGRAEARILHEVILIFQTEDARHEEWEMDCIHISIIPVRERRREEIRKILPNLLGQDFLRRYRLKFVADYWKNEAYLEKSNL